MPEYHTGFCSTSTVTNRQLNAGAAEGVSWDGPGHRQAYYCITKKRTEIGDGKTLSDHWMLQCPLQFTSSVLSATKAQPSQITAPIHSLERSFHCLQISKQSFKHAQPKFKTKKHHSLPSYELDSMILMGPFQLIFSDYGQCSIPGGVQGWTWF